MSPLIKYKPLTIFGSLRYRFRSWKKHLTYSPNTSFLFSKLLKCTGISANSKFQKYLHFLLLSLQIQSTSCTSPGNGGESWLLDSDFLARCNWLQSEPLSASSSWHVETLLCSQLAVTQGTYPSFPSETSFCISLHQQA